MDPLVLLGREVHHRGEHRGDQHPEHLVPVEERNARPGRVDAVVEGRPEDRHELHDKEQVPPAPAATLARCLVHGVTPSSWGPAGSRSARRPRGIRRARGTGRELRARGGWLVIRLAYLEPEADTGGGGEGVLVVEARGETTGDRGVEGAEVPVEALGELVVEHQGAGVFLAGALGGFLGGTETASGRLRRVSEVVLLVAVVGG